MRTLPSQATARVVSEAGRAAGTIFVNVFHALLPWAMWIGLTFIGLVLRFGFPHDRVLAAALVATAGAVLAALDYHLRSHRMTFVGKLIGPATAVAGSVITVVWLTQGYSADLALVYLIGGGLACIIWDVWLHHADRHDFSLAFPVAAEKAGAGRARLTVSRRPALPAAGGGRRAPKLTGTVRWPGGEVSPDEAAERATHMEGALHYPPGSFSMSPDASDAAGSEFIISDPRVLDEPLPWPGPSAPGQSVVHPFRLGARQDGDPFLADMLPVFLGRGMGKTGSGKTTSWLWNSVAEGVTRRDYAVVAADGNKGLQFLGPLRPALHGIATTDAETLLQLQRLHIAREMRIEYLARRHLTEWQPGCGLSYLEGWLEEAPSVWQWLKEAARYRSSAFTMKDYLEDVKAGRTAGLALRASLQEAHHTEMPTVARAQMSPICFGVDARKDAELGLSERQMRSGCQPQLWGSSKPGMAYVDWPTMDPRDVTMPVRFFDWGRDASAVAAYMADWPAESRPLDPVTAEAMAWTPGAAPASEALPGPGGRLGAGRPDRPARSAVANVTQLFGGRTDAEDAELTLRRLLLARYADGRTTFTVKQLTNEKVPQQCGRSRPWLYQVLRPWEQQGLVELLAGRPETWEVKPTEAERRDLGTGEEEQG